MSSTDAARDILSRHPIVDGHNDLPFELRAIVNYDASPHAAPWVALRGLPSGQQTCLSVAHLVSPGGVATFSHPVCAAAR